jgi:hypothetical protein
MFTVKTQHTTPPTSSRVPKGTVTESAYEGDVLREQLDDLIKHAAGQVQCGCSTCRRYLRVRVVLLEIFGQPQAAGTDRLRRLTKGA